MHHKCMDEEDFIKIENLKPHRMRALEQFGLVKRK